LGDLARADPTRLYLRRKFPPQCTVGAVLVAGQSAGVGPKAVDTPVSVDRCS